MASKRKSPWTDDCRIRPPPTNQNSHSDMLPPPPTIVSDPATVDLTTAGATSTTSLPLVPVVAGVPWGQREEEDPAIAALKVALEALKAELNELAPLQLSVVGLLECIADSQVGEQNHDMFEARASELTGLATLLRVQVVESKPRNLPLSIANVARAIGEQTQIIKESQGQSIRRMKVAPEGAGIVLECYRQIGVLFRQLQEDISQGVWDVQREQQMDARLRDLSPAHEARYNAALPTTATKRVGCTKGTRVKLLEDARSWACDPEGPKIHWLNGMAGTGKTTIAYTLCKMLQENKQLGASFFCSRNSPDCRDVNRIIPTIAYQLGRYSNPYRQALCSIVEGDPDIATYDLSTQFEQLISKPMAKVSKAMPVDVVVVIDALDECTDVGGTRDILNLLLQRAASLPIKFFISSRPEPAISNRMTSPDGSMRSILWLHDIELSLVQTDIKTYLNEALKWMGATSSEIDQLAARAGVLFIFAATAVRYVLPEADSVDHRQRLLTVLKLQSNQMRKTYRDIDELYITILANALDEKKLEKVELDGRRRALHTIVCSREPLTIASLAEILDLPDSRAVELAIQPLQSVLHVAENSNIVSTLHASFPDFLLDKERAKRFHCDESLQNAFLAKCCFRVMDQGLRFNICALESSYQLDREVPGLQDQIDKTISAGLFYSCMYWGDHVTQAPFSFPLLSLLDSFMRYQLLFWLEVLNIKGRAGCGDGVLSHAMAWLLNEDSRTDLSDFVHDARSFVINLASNPVSLSTPHIYLSLLPFTSRRSHVWKTYWPKTRGLVWVDGIAMEAEGKSLLATWVVGGEVRSIAQSSDGKIVVSGSQNWEHVGGSMKHFGEVIIWDASRGVRVLGPWKHPEGVVYSVALSPDNTRVASGLSSGTICIRCASNGDPTVGPLHGHSSAIISVAFSPDGTRLASGSNDRTIRIWDAYTGASVSKPLNGHQGAVQSVAFSPNGKHLASGSRDGTIRVWDSWTGAVAQEPVRGHTNAIHSIVYSHDGRRLASGSQDCTVRVWDISNGTLLAGPFNGHALAVLSVSFSPDGTQVVSGSRDGTICIWDAVNSKLLAGPFEGHYGGVNSVLFSVDGTRILSGSGDKTIRVWDLHHDGALVAGPFKGHTDKVRSVAFSPDGTRIVSGSNDRTLRIWNGSTGALLVGPIKAHTGFVNSIAFSPDGSQIASGSDDCTIRLCNSHTGEAINKLFPGHTRPVTSVAFSPDGSRIVSGSYPPGRFGKSLDVRIDDGSHGCTVQMQLANDGSVLWKSDAHAKIVNCVAFSLDGMRVVSGSYDHTILVLDARDGAVLCGPFMGHTGSVYSVAFSPDGTRVVSSSSDRTVRVWSVKSGTVVCGLLKGHTESVGCVAFSRDGAYVISGSEDHTIRIWDVAVIAHAGATCSDNWFINRKGWLTNSKSRRLFWVPPDLRWRFGILTRSNPAVINASCVTRIDDTILLGDRWHECYVRSADSVLS